MELEIIDASFHRNGIAGQGFYAILFKDRDKTMIASLFDDPGYCAVYEVSQLQEGNIKFAKGNSWRGDHYEGKLRALLEKFEQQNGANRIGCFAI